MRAYLGVDIGTSSSKGVLVARGRPAPAQRDPRAPGGPAQPGPRRDGRQGVVDRVPRPRRRADRTGRRRGRRGRGQRHGPVRAPRRRRRRAGPSRDPLWRRHPRPGPDRRARRRARRRAGPGAVGVDADQPGGRAQAALGARHRAGGMARCPAALHAGLLAGLPADRGVRPGPPLGQPVHPAARPPYPGLARRLGTPGGRAPGAAAAALAGRGGGRDAPGGGRHPGRGPGHLAAPSTPGPRRSAWAPRPPAT